MLGSRHVATSDVSYKMYRWFSENPAFPNELFSEAKVAVGTRPVIFKDILLPLVFILCDG